MEYSIAIISHSSFFKRDKKKKEKNENKRGIYLLNTTFKVLSKTTLQRIEAILIYE